MSQKEKPEKRSNGSSKQRPEQQAWPSDRNFRILAIDGGGIKGIFPAAILAELENLLPKGNTLSDHFDLITGTSTGGIIALGLAAGLNARDMLDMYIQNGAKIFPQSNFGFIKRLFVSRYNSLELENALKKTLHGTKIDEANIALCIPTCEGTHGEVYIYKTPHHPRFKLDAREKMITVALATSAAPTYLKIQKHNGFKFIDGGLYANNPIMTGVVDALSSFDVPREKIQVLSLGCGTNLTPTNWFQEKFGGFLSWSSAIGTSIDLQSQNTLGQANLLIGAENITRIEPSAEYGKLALDDYENAARYLPDDAKLVLGKLDSRSLAPFLKCKAHGVRFFKV